MANRKQVAVVIVDRGWFNAAGIRRFFGKQKTTDRDVSHFILAPLCNQEDPRGLWLDGVTTKAVKRQDGKAFTMKFMIPWPYIHGLGVVEESEARPIGFKPDATTIDLRPRTEE